MGWIIVKSSSGRGEFRCVDFTVGDWGIVSEVFILLCHGYTHLLFTISPRESSFLTLWTKVLGLPPFSVHFQTILCLEFHWKYAQIIPFKVSRFTDSTTILIRAIDLQTVLIGRNRVTFTISQIKSFFASITGILVTI